MVNRNRALILMELLGGTKPEGDLLAHFNKNNVVKLFHYQFHIYMSTMIDEGYVKLNEIGYKITGKGRKALGEYEQEKWARVREEFDKMNPPLA